MPTLAVTNFNVVCATLGGFITLFGLVSYLFKEQFYLSEAYYALGNREALDDITLYFSRLVLGVQLVLAGVQLPSRYLLKEWKSLSLLLGPGMLGMWLCSSLVIYGLVPKLPFLHALAIAACITPTDPVLSNSIVKGKFADKNIPRPLQRIIIAESGANDGLGYPFLFFAMYLIQYTEAGGARKAMGLWFGETWGYTILLSVVYGVAVGWVAKELLHWAEENKYIDRESFLVFAVALALFIIGTCGMIGSDDVLACFIAGNVFTIDDWFRLETLDDSLQPTIDMLLNLSVFMWFGAVCPWPIFLNNDIIPIYRLVSLGILILLLRRIPVVFAMHKYIHQIEEFRQAAFVGFFGPIGVSAIFYLYVSLEYVRLNFTVDGEVVHGLSIPVGKLGFSIPRSLSSALSTSIDIESERGPHSGVSTPGPHRTTTVATSTPVSRALRFIPARFRKQPATKSGRPRDIPPEPVAFRIGRTVIPERNMDSNDLCVNIPSPSSSSTIANPHRAAHLEQGEATGVYTIEQDIAHSSPARIGNERNDINSSVEERKFGRDEVGCRAT
ncbi:Na+/H+ antiporter [Microsporum canis CBS 113480]|uniref:Na+/H+ antiporter n=1 Tax=Arthroderma otae (strain ATCC MYA-4605 / CBS 113480) TaxID=554155 RepID=C5FRL8_ARTOC|nr:Na+/H+ antiporter [Microsporum canis CBS 113480]EEQ32521.1 Na+/H+ antiporter [Microsporum canis CBS 113480]